jgi:hypothetical protein
MDKWDLQERLTTFAVRIVKMVDSMPNSVAGLAIARQVVRSGTSPSANYRAACIAKSELPISRMEPLSQECSELLSIIVKSIVTTKTRMTTDNH